MGISMVVAALACVSGAPPGTEVFTDKGTGIVTVYDSISDTTTRSVIVQSSNSFMGGSLTFVRAQVSYPGRQLSSAPQFVFLVFESSSSDWRWLHVENVSWLLNSSERFQCPAARAGEVGTIAGSVNVQESVACPLTLAQFRDLARAATAKAQLVGTQIAIDSAGLGHLRAFAASLPSS